MPYPTNMVYCRWEFGVRLGAGTEDVEVQNFGIWGHVEDPVQPPFPGWTNVVNDGAQRLANAWKNNMDPGLFSPSIRFNRAIVYHYDQPHQQVLDRGESAGTGGAWAGEPSGSGLPLENSIVLSLYAFQPGTYQFQPGRHRGRVYLPTPVRAALDKDGMLADASRTQLQGNVEDFWDDVVGTFDNIHIRPHISSVAGQFATPITYGRIGSVIDTQRKRRNKLSENYVNFPLPI